MVVAPRSQRGAFAIFVAVGLTALLGALGLAIDGGRLLANRSELQAAADACALGAVSELVCSATDNSCLSKAAKKGVTLANMHSRDLQSTTVAMTESDVTFSTTLKGTYDKTQNASRFARCVIAPAGGVSATFLGVVGINRLSAKAEAVATLTGRSEVCSNAPIALCGSGPFTKGQWIAGDFEKSSSKIRWTQSGSGKGASDIDAALRSGATTCMAKDASLTIETKTGLTNGVSAGYNTRFGIYASKYVKSGNIDFSNGAPDYTGYAYPTTSIPLATSGTQKSAYSDYLSHASSNDPFNTSSYDGTAGSKNPSYKGDAKASKSQLQTNGTNRRILSVVVADSCGSSTSTVKDSACVLMLNPMDSGTGSGTLPVYFEYLGKPSDPDSPCKPNATVSTLPSSGGIGNAVPTLVR